MTIQQQQQQQQQQHSVAILAQDSFINFASASFWAGLGGVRCACLEQALSFIAKVLAFVVLDTEWRSRLFPCRNSMRPSLVLLDYGCAAATFAAAFPCRRLRSAFSRFRLRCAFGGSAALPLVGSARFLLLCRSRPRSSSCSPRCWSLALLLWFWRCPLWVTCPSLHG